jgi:isopentenyl-diphosphate Delta-isomerase
MDWLKQEQYIAEVNKEDEIIGKVEKWKAHKEAILHRAFTIAVFYNGEVLLQHRKHPAFDGYFDVTISSHQLYRGERLESDLEAIYNTLKREMNIEKKHIVREPEYKGKVYYLAKATPLSEHEIDYIYTVELKELPEFPTEFAYGYTLAPINKVKDVNWPLWSVIAPWTREALVQDLV